MKNLFLSFLVVILSVSAFAQQKLTLDDVVNYKFMPRYVRGINSMHDGLHYTVYEVDPLTGKAEINMYSYKSGKKIKTLVDILAGLTCKNMTAKVQSSLN